MKFLEPIAARIEDFVLDIYKVKVLEKVEEIDPIALDFIDCTPLVENHKKSLTGNVSNY